MAQAVFQLHVIARGSLYSIKHIERLVFTDDNTANIKFITFLSKTEICICRAWNLIKDDCSFKFAVDL